MTSIVELVGFVIFEKVDSPRLVHEGCSLAAVIEDIDISVWNDGGDGFECGTYCDK